MREKLDIGSVLFGKRLGANICHQPITGQERVNLLRRFYRGEHLPDSLVAFAFGRGPIKSEDVNWDTAGDAVKLN